MVFGDRSEAGRSLAPLLAGERDPIVVGLARGGVAVAAEVARELRAPLDALAVRKVGHPLEPEYALGAVTPDGAVFLRASDGLSDAQLDAAVAHAREAAAELDRRLHATRPAVEVGARTCVLVDDGLATGATMRAAVRWARTHAAARVVVAVPVGSPGTVARLRSEADAVVCLETPHDLGAVGLWYRDFSPVSEARVLELLRAASAPVAPEPADVAVAVGAVSVPGVLSVPAGARGAVVFAHGSGSGRHSPRNRLVAGALQEAGLATLLLDLLTEREAEDRRYVFDIPLLSARTCEAVRWLHARLELPVGVFGASTGAAAALIAAAELPGLVAAVVSRGGRPDLAEARLADVRAPTLLIVGGEDREVLELNEAAARSLRCEHELAIVPGATHLFEEPGALERVCALSAAWFRQHVLAHPRPAV